MEEPAGALRLAAIGVLNLGFSMVLGVFAHDYVWRNPALSGSLGAVQRLRRIARIGAAAGLLGMVALLWSECAILGEVPLSDAANVLPDVLASSHFGAVWIGGMLSLMALSFCVTWPGLRGQPGARMMALAALGAFALCRALASHAVADGNGSFWVLVEACHLLAVALWVGLVLTAGSLASTLPGSAPLLDRMRVPCYLARVSAIASWTLAVVLATGTLNTWRALPAVTWPWQTSYGEILLAKLGLVALAIGLAGINRFQVLPALADGGAAEPAASRHWTGRLAILLRIEGIALLAAMAAAALLSTTASR